jgi:hypothetical protein
MPEIAARCQRRRPALSAADLKRHMAEQEETKAVEELRQMPAQEER